MTILHGETDDLGFKVANNPVQVHDVHAALLNQLPQNPKTFGTRTADGVCLRLFRSGHSFGTMDPNYVTSSVFLIET
jgi:hypothetical protein